MLDTEVTQCGLHKQEMPRTGDPTDRSGLGGARLGEEGESPHGTEGFPGGTGATAEVAATHRPCLPSPQAVNKQLCHSANHAQRPEKPSCSPGRWLKESIAMRSHYETISTRATVWDSAEVQEEAWQPRPCGLVPATLWGRTPHSSKTTVPGLP